MTTPIDRMLDVVQWRELPQPHVSMAGDPDALYATHEGEIGIEGQTIRCYVLNDGQRVFDADSVEAFFGAADAPSRKQSPEEADHG